MLHPWSKPVTLSISPLGVAIKVDEQPAQLLDSNTTPNQLLNVLEQHAELLKNQRVRVVISNALCRFLMLPWQDNIVRHDDWLALAATRFEAHYGAVASSWKVLVHLGEHGQMIPAVAIDSTLLAVLETASTQFNFKLVKTAPLLSIVMQQVSQKQDLYKNNHHLMIVEPEYLVLLQSDGHDWQQIIVDSPPSGQESAHAAQMIQRAQKTLQSDLNSDGYLCYVSSALYHHWQLPNKKTVMLPMSTSAHHAVWMAGL